MAKQIRYPTTFTVVDNGGWTNPGNAAGADNTYATCDVATSNNVSTLFSDFNFDIDTTQINSIKVYGEHKISSNTFENWIDYIVYNDSTQVKLSRYEEDIPTTDTIINFDITSYFTLSDINSNKLKIKVYALNTFTSRTFYLDNLYVEIDYVRVPSKAFGQII